MLDDDDAPVNSAFRLRAFIAGHASVSDREWERRRERGRQSINKMLTKMSEFRFKLVIHIYYNVPISL